MCTKDDHIYVKECVNVVFACDNKKNKIYGRSYDYVNHAKKFFFVLNLDLMY